jgi:hypothetical protein
MRTYVRGLYRFFNKGGQNMQAPYAHLLSRIESLEAALKDMLLVHFPYVNPDDDPKAKRQQFHRLMIGALNGEPYTALE